VKNLHLKGSDMSYFAHARRASAFGLRCFLWGAQVFIHAIFPDRCADTTVKIVQEIQRLESEEKVNK